jgi:hypothetical protein
VSSRQRISMHGNDAQLLVLTVLARGEQGT